MRHSTYGVVGQASCLFVVSVVEITLVVDDMAIKGDQEISFMAEEHSIPAFLYKYGKLDARNKRRIQRIFTHNELYIPSPTTV